MGRSESMVVFKLRTPLSAIINAKAKYVFGSASVQCELKVSIVLEWCIRKQTLHIEKETSQVSENL